jgi:hypothetical protein
LLNITTGGVPLVTPLRESFKFKGAATVKDGKDLLAYLVINHKEGKI